MKRKILVSVLYCVLFFVCLEGGARLVLLHTSFLDSKRIISDSYFRLKLIRTCYSEGVRWFFDGDYLYDPLMGWILKPNINGSIRNDPNKALHTNSKGIRGTFEYSYQPPDKKRILVLGDSFTFGDEVADDKTYPYYLQQLLPGSQVLNFGICGYGHDQMLLYFKNEGVKYKPEIVILGFAPSDLSRNMLVFYLRPKPKFKLADNGLQLTNVPVPTIRSVLNQEVYKLKIIDWVLMTQSSSGRGKYYFRERWKLTEAIFDELVKVIKECGAKPLFVYISTPLAISKNKQSTEKAFEDSFEQYCKERGVPYLFTRPYFKSAIQKGVHLKEEGHWDAQGNLIVAQAIAEYFKDFAG